MGDVENPAPPSPRAEQLDSRGNHSGRPEENESELSAPIPEDDPRNMRNPDFAAHFIRNTLGDQNSLLILQEAKERRAKKSKKNEPQVLPWWKDNWFYHNVVSLGEDEVLEDKPGDGWYRSSRKRLGRILESKAVIIAIVVLLLLDLCFLVTEIILSEEFPPVGGEPPHAVETAEIVLKWLSVSILIAFSVEMVLYMYVYNLRFFLHPWLVLDLIIISFSLFMELYLRNVLAAGLLVILRMWRLVRVFHGVYEMAKEAHHETILQLHETAHTVFELHEELQRVLQEKKAAEAKCTAAEHDNAALRTKLAEAEEKHHLKHRRKEKKGDKAEH